MITREEAIKTAIEANPFCNAHCAVFKHGDGNYYALAHDNPQGLVNWLRFNKDFTAEKGEVFPTTKEMRK